ncbi:tRNA intron endonuclease, partial [Cooperia oncophora]
LNERTCVVDVFLRISSPLFFISGYGRVRVLKESPPSTSSQNVPFEERSLSESEHKGAKVTAIETTASELCKEERACIAKKRKVAEGGMDSAENSKEDVLGTAGELKIVNLRKLDPDEDIYRWLDEFEVPVPCTREFRARHLVYYDLWSRGYYLTSGVQFGTAWLVYEGPPGDVHATFLVDIIFDDEMLMPSNLIALIRVAVQVKKNLVLAVVSSDNTQPHYVMMDWLRPQDVDE